MQLHVTTEDGTPIYLQIVNQVKYLVASGGLTEGEQLPTVRRLAEQLLVNPNTVSRAYRELESEGVVVTRRGAGVFASSEGSNLAASERERILCRHVDQLLSDARHMNISLDEVLSLVRARHEEMNP